jgi:hypothetical protein
LKFRKEINPSLVISCLFRAAIDCRAYGFVKTELIDLLLTELKKFDE